MDPLGGRGGVRVEFVTLHMNMSSENQVTSTTCTLIALPLTVHCHMQRLLRPQNSPPNQKHGRMATPTLQMRKPTLSKFK